ncbi:MAG: HAMP domain-containing protein [Deferribacteres bacterium]|nr:HAMP domain-containing protein [Deferribacteres bacterium]
MAKGEDAEGLTTSFVLNLRRLEKNYMFFRDKRSFLELNTALSKLRDTAPDCTECISYKEAINELISAYSKSASIEKRLQVTGNRLEEIAVKIAHRERQKIRSFIAVTNRFLLAAVALLCILGPLFVYKTANYIVTPINRLAEITKRIAAGDLNLRAPLKERDETYSLALSFNTMLDHLRERENQLVEKEKELYQSKKLASIGILTSGVAHELTNPLNNISMIAQTYTELYDKLSREDRLAFMNNVEKEAERIRDIVRDLLDFSKPKEKSFREADINTVVEKSLKLVQNMLDISNIETYVNLGAGLGRVFIDEHQIQQVLVNLITNAIQAMPGGGKLYIETGLSSNGEFVEIAIRDTGKGIPPEFLPHIFDPFFSTKGVEGTGLGMSVSYGIIKTHKGNIRVQSKVGEGSTFTVELPVYRGNAA